MHLIQPKGSRLKWDIRLRIHDGRIVCIPGDRDEDTARRLGGRIEMLVRAKQHGEPPPGELATWIDNMPTRLADRLIALGLLDARRLYRAKPLEDLFKEYGRIVAARKTNRRAWHTPARRPVRPSSL